MIIWSGYGFLVAVFVFASALAMEFAVERWTNDDAYYQDVVWPLPLALVIAGFLSFVGGLWLNRPSGRVLIDEQTGERIIESGGHNTLFFIKMQWWGPILIAIAFVVAIYRVMEANG